MEIFDRNMPDFEEKVLARLTGRLDPPSKLRDVISTNFMQDVVCTYRYPLIISDEGMASVPITQSILQEKGMSVRQLHDLAIENTRKQYHFQAIEMENILSGYGVACDEMLWMPERFPMIVMTNQYHLNGASCLMDSNFLDEVADTYFKGKDYLILPSSIHEVIAIEDSSAYNANELLNLVQDVNSTVVRPEERLSDSIYRFDVNRKQLQCIAAPKIQKVPAL